MNRRAIAWTAATVVGLAAGGFALHFPGSYGESSWSLVAGLFGVILGFANGALLGALQWVALRADRALGVRLVVAMGLAVGITHGLHDGSSTAAPYVVVALACGAAMAAIFRGLLGERDRLRLAVVGLGWAAGLVVALYGVARLGLPWSETPLGWGTAHAAQGIFVGVVWGVATTWVGADPGARGTRSA